MLPAPTPAIARVAAPTPPAPAAKQPFPLVATLAPVLMSLVLWMVTQSVFSLVFAALGPVIAVGSLLDGRRGGRRKARLENERFEAELAQARAEVEQAHAQERAALEALAPTALEVASGLVHWGSAEPAQLVLGRARLPSALRLEGAERRGDDPVAVQLRALRESAAVLERAPLVIPAGRGVGIVGPVAQRAALARALLVQALAALSPATHEVCGAEDWLAELPHRASRGADGLITGPDHTLRIATASEAAALEGVDTVVQLEGVSARIVRGAGTGQVFAPEYLSDEQARAWARTAAAAARRAGIGRSDLPAAVAFAELDQPVDGVLASCIGHGPAGPLGIDLALDGPHAIVGGTTGSGKSELLTTWLLGMAALRSPAELTILLVDFKGGTSFGALPQLPHCVGLVTDLDPAAASRALASLSAELRYRERTIADAGARSITEVPGLARLVIAVDEFAAMAAALPELHALFADIAARGRSLGVHLVLCTQRPGGVVRDAVLANASLRLSLRVNNRADSVAVIGSPDAARGDSAPGRAWLSLAGGEPVEVQVALATADDIAAASERWGTRWTPRRPWLDPLPRELEPAAAAGAIALVDLPGEQAQRPLLWHPARGSLLVIGGGGSGKSGALRAVAAVHGGQLVAPGIEAAWDAVHSPADLLLLDDLDAVVAALGPEHQQAFIDRLGALVRGGTRVVLAVQRLGASLQSIGSLCDHRLVLRMPSRQEHVIAGGSSDSFDPGLPPGAGHWLGDRVQLVHVPAVPPAAPATSVPLAARTVALAVSPRPQALAARLAALGLGEVPVRDPEGWLADWATFGALAREGAVLFHECSPTEFRQLTRRRTLPPPIADAHGTGWLLEPEAEPVRVAL